MANDGPRAQPSRYDVDIAIVGAGVSGLATAYLLQEAGQRVRAYEAAEVIGGRVQSFVDLQTGLVVGDRGPTWVWPAYQPVVASWLKRLNIRTFAQFEAGDAIVEIRPGQAPTRTMLPRKAGSMRIEGGTRRLVEALARRLPAGAVTTNFAIGQIESVAEGIVLHHERGEYRPVRAQAVIVAVPPRVAANAITWLPELPTALVRALNAMPTWMAPHAKAVVVYDRAFWKGRGLSGRIASRLGPMMEVHDHSSADGETAALFGFVGSPHDMREVHRSKLAALIVEQLVRCFGPEAQAPIGVFIEDWASNPWITQPDDLSGAQQHPSVGPSVLRDMIFHNRLTFASAETSSVSPGVLEGALHAAENAVGRVLSAIEEQGRK